jgi:hypothetical protein
MKNINSRNTALWARVTGSLALGVSLLSGCSQTTIHQTDNNERFGDPIVAQPEGAETASSGVPSHLLPDPIDFSDGKRFSQRTVEATIVDTTTFGVQRQLTGPHTGVTRKIKNMLPKHSRDKTLREDDESRAMPVGQMMEMDRVNVAGGTGFPTIQQTPWIPPDATLAIGPEHVVVTVNSAIAFYDKEGNEQFSADLGEAGTPGFFEAEGAADFVFDPKCFYDHKTGRFVVIVLERIGLESWIDIAVSDDSDPNGIWYKYRTFSVVTVGRDSYWVDYPGFGFDDNAIYVTGNLFYLFGPNGDGFAGEFYRIFDKTPMLTGDPVTFTDFAPDESASLQVAQMFGEAPQCYFVARESSGSMRVFTINNPLTDPEIESVVVNYMSNAFSPGSGAFNGGSADQVIDTLDGRLMNAHVRNGKLYTAHGIDGPGALTIARWYQIDLNGWPSSGEDPTLAQQGEINDGSRYYFFPAIYTDKNDNVGMVMAKSSIVDFASVQISGRTPSDPPGVMSAPVELAIGDRAGNGRWGDYFDIAIDPTDDETFWVIGMFQRPFGWQTWVDSFTIETPCPADLTEDGLLNFFDIAEYLEGFGAQDPSADLTGDGLINFFDIAEYLAQFGAGCP